MGDLAVKFSCCVRRTESITSTGGIYISLFVIHKLLYIRAVRLEPNGSGGILGGNRRVVRVRQLTEFVESLPTLGDGYGKTDML